MPNDHYAGWPAPRAQYPWKQGDILIADELNAAIANARHGGGMFLPDFLPAGQPDGTTDLASYIQQAIDAAAGHGALVIPANATPYTIGRALLIPSNTHLIIEAGATIKILGGTNASCMQIVASASNILIELYGTLDGNASNQTPTQTIPSAGITGQGNVPFSNTLIWGGRSGLITNFKTWPVAFAMVTNVEINGITITNCGAAPGINGITTRHNVTSGVYNAGTGVMTLTSDVHGINVGDTFTYVAAAVSQAYLQGEFVATSVTSTTVTCTAPTGMPGGPSWSGTAGTQGRIGTCIKAFNSGFVNCTVRNIRDLGLCFYGGVVGGYIRGCDMGVGATGPLIYSDAGQPGSNIDCEISGCYTHDNHGGGPTVASNQYGVSHHNSRLYDNIVTNCARGGININFCDGVDVYGNSLHNNAPALQGLSQQSGQLAVGSAATRANIWGNTIRDPGPSVTAQQVIVVTAMTYVNATGLTTLTLASAPTLPIAVGDKFIVFNILGFVAPDGSSTSYLQLNGSWTAATGTTGSTVVYTAPSGLGTITLLGTSGGVIASTLAVTTHITASNYSSDAAGNMSLTTTAPHKLAVGDAFVLASILSNTPAGNTSAGLLAGVQIATAGTAGSTLNFVTVPSIASFAITSGNLWSANFGIAIDAPDYCRIAGNRIGDYQKPGVMTACIGGTWGLNGASEGNYFGPRNQPDPDVSLYGSGVNGFNYDLLFGTTLANNSVDGQVTFRGITQASNPQSTYYPPQGLTPGWNRGPVPHGEVDFFLGEGLGSPGGFDFLQVAVIKIVASPVGPPIPYDPATGIVTLTTTLAHGILPGNSFVLSGITGTDSNNGLDVVRLNGSHVANSDTTGTTLTYTMVSGLTVISTAAGATVVPSGGGGGVLKTSVGVGGSLLAGDGYGNTRLGGALVHGAMQSASLSNAGTVTVNPNTSFVLLQNSSSIASASVVLPALTPLSFQSLGGGAELELNFQNPIGALSMTAAVGTSVVGSPTTISAAGTSVNFVLSGSTWRRRASDANSAAAGGPFLPVSGGTVTGSTILTTNTRLGMDTAAFGGVPNMFMRSDGGAFVFHADGWNEYTPSAFRGINFKVFGNGGADEYWGVTGGPNGTGSTLKAYSVSGGWPCIGSILASNEGQLMLGNDTGTVLNIQGPTGQLTKNYIQIVGGGPGVPATFNVVGESPGHMELVANGSGNVYIGNDNWTGTAGKATVEIGGLTAAEVNGVRIAGNSTGNAPVISSTGDDTNISLVLGPKGNGSLQAASTGNARGTYSTDWQHVRSTNAQVASGNQAVISGGNSNTASADYTSVGGGFQNAADGTYATIPGGQRAWARGQHGWLGWACGLLQGIQEGDAQGSWRLLIGVSTGGAAVRLTSDRGAINSVSPGINSVLVGNDRAVSMTVQLIGVDNTATTNRTNAYFNDILMSKDALSASAIYLGTPRTLGVDLPTVAITVGAEGLLSIVVTPANANTWHFLAKLSCAEAY